MLRARCIVTIEDTSRSNKTFWAAEEFISWRLEGEGCFHRGLQCQTRDFLLLAPVGTGSPDPDAPYSSRGMKFSSQSGRKRH
nr:uncharacterized protein LOC120360386 [Saimiri boliviensis boliviensis]